MLPEKNYQCSFNGKNVTIYVDVTISQKSDSIIVDYPIASVIRQDTMLLHHPEQLLTYRNDSLMLVLEGICIEDTVVTDVIYYGLQLFKKKGR
jgi:hypothetical protein